MEENEKDAKEVAESSPAQSAQQDDKEQSAVESSSTSEQTESQAEESLADVVTKEAKASLARESAEEGAAQKVSSTEEEETAEGEEATEGGEKTAEKEESQDVPKEFHEHPAWKRIIGERNEAREKATRLEASAKANESLVEYCRTRGITDDQFKQALEVTSLLNADPAKAYEALRPIVEALESHMGLRLPEDLSKKVEEGILDPETAKEVARLRAERQFGAQRQQTEVQRQQAQLQSSMVEGLNAWDANKRTTDPDFQEKSDLIRGVFLNLCQQTDANGQPLNPIRTPQDAVALAEKAYAAVNEKLKKFSPEKPEKRVLSTKNAAVNNNSKKKPGSLKEAIAFAMRDKHGVDLED